jgi:serine/threonine-protein kinase
MSGAFEHIHGKYEVLAKIKEGGMGAIYKVRHRLLGETRVVKVMKPQLEGDAEFARRFLREAQTAIKLRHANIAQLYDFSTDEQGNAYIVMEYIQGVDLRELQRRHGPPPVGLTLEIAVQGLAALGFLHRRNMVHRDISPDNLMLSRDADGKAVVKLIDLGIVKVLESDHGLTSTGVFLGKVRYASPEQFRGGEGAVIDQRADLYSFGIVLYELLTGKYPIQGSTNSALIAGHLYQPPVAFDVADPEGRVPAPLRDIVMRLLDKEPDRRFPTADELAGALRALQERFPLRAEDIDAALAGVAEAEEAAAGTGFDSTQDRLDKQFGIQSGSAPAWQVGLPTVGPTGAPPVEKPTILVPTGVSGEARARAIAEVVAAAEQHLERNEVQQAAELVRQGSEALGESPELRTVRSRVERASQLAVPPPPPGAVTAPTVAMPPPPAAVPAAAPAPPATAAPKSRTGLLLGVVAAALVAAVGGLLVLRGVIARKAPAAGEALSSRGQVSAEAGTAGRAEPGGATVSAAGTGTLVVHAIPWGEVTEVKDAGGVARTLPASPTTPLAIELPAGAYTVTLRNPLTGKTATASATVEPGVVARCRVVLEQVDGDAFLARLGR